MSMTKEERVNWIKDFARESQSTSKLQSFKQMSKSPITIKKSFYLKENIQIIEKIEPKKDQDEDISPKHKKAIKMFTKDRLPGIKGNQFF